MKKLSKLIVFLAVLLVLPGIPQAASNKQNPNPGQNPEAATFNLSFPVIATDIIEVFYQKTPIYAEDGVTIIDWVLALDESGDPIPIEVSEVISSEYTGSYPGNDGSFYTEYIVDETTGCAVDEDLDGEADMTDPISMLTWLQSNINLSPGIGPSGKMNFASGGGGWIPTMPGWHRIWLHLNDPLITLSTAIVNNDEHYILSTGCMAEELNHNKLELSGIVGNSTYIDVLVERPSGKKTK